jgi:anti-sigma B factor antagonist
LETAIGVFSSRDTAEAAVKELIDRKVPKESIVFLSLSEAEAKSVGQGLGATVGGFMGAATGMSAGVIAATLLVVPGIGPVFALGFGAAALLGLAGAGAGSAIGGSAAGQSPLPVPDASSSEDAALFLNVLKEGHSLIVVRTEAQETAHTACGILDRLGLAVEGHTPAKMQTAVRHAEGVAIVDIEGRITLGEGNIMLRETIRQLVEKGSKKILLNLHGVGYVDSSGVGELVKSYTTVRAQGGQMKIVNLSRRLYDLLQMTRLYMVFDIQPDEASAIRSFGQ